MDGPMVSARCSSWFVVDTSALRQRFDFLIVMSRRRYAESGCVVFEARSSKLLLATGGRVGLVGIDIAALCVVLGGGERTEDGGGEGELGGSDCVPLEYLSSSLSFFPRNI